MFLERRGATSIVSACNSVSASLALSLFDPLETPPANVIEMVGPTVNFFRASEARLLLVATPATILSGIYQNAFTMIGKQCEFLPIPDLAKAIEFGSGDDDIERMIYEALSPLQGTFDVLILACTHYPLVLDTFERVAGGAAVFDPAQAVAQRVERRLWPREAGDGRLVFATTQESALFEARVEELFGPGHDIEIVTLA